MLLALIWPFFAFDQLKDKQSLTLSKNGKITHASGITLGTGSRYKIFYDQDAHPMVFVANQGNLTDTQPQKKGKVGTDEQSFYDTNGYLSLTLSGKGQTHEIPDVSQQTIGQDQASYLRAACVLAYFEPTNLLSGHTGDLPTQNYARSRHPEITENQDDPCSKYPMKLVKN